MKSLLIDNWTIEKAVESCTLNGISSEIKRIMCFLVLWDDVYYLDNSNSNWWKESAEKSDDLKFLLDLKAIKIDDTSEAMIDQNFEAEFIDKETPIVAKGAISYLINAEKRKMHYAPVEERAKFIEKYNLERLKYSRNEIIKTIDKDLLEYYKNSAEKIHEANIYLGLESLFSMIDEIRKKTSLNYSESINTLKEKHMIKAFRNWVDGFENDINAGKELLWEDYLSSLREIQEGMKLDFTIKGEFPVSYPLEFTPMIKIELGIPLMSAIKSVTPKFLFPCYLYRKGLKNSRRIVFPTHKYSLIR